MKEVENHCSRATTLAHVFVKCSLINMAFDKDWLEDVF